MGQRKVSSPTVFLLMAWVVVAAPFAAGRQTPDFTFVPGQPNIGELVEFEIVGVTEAIDSAFWNHGMPGCPGFPAQLTCYPLYTDCLMYAHKFMTGGEKTVGLTVVIDGVSHGPIEHTVCVTASGACSGGGTGREQVDGPCTLLFSDGFETGDAEGWTTVE